MRDKPLPIATFPSPHLRAKALEVDITDDRLFEIVQLLAARMEVTLDKLGGIGLAAPQVATNLRVIVISMSDPMNHEDGLPKADPLSDAPPPQRPSFSGVFINPTWTPLPAATLHDSDELCLSVFTTEPIQVQRYHKINVEAIELRGDTALKFTAVLDGVAATCWQHECDHLDGRTIADGLSPLRQDMIRRRRDKIRKEATRR